MSTSAKVTPLTRLQPEVFSVIGMTPFPFSPCPVPSSSLCAKSQSLLPLRSKPDPILTTPLPGLSLGMIPLHHKGGGKRGNNTGDDGNVEGGGGLGGNDNMGGEDMGGGVNKNMPPPPPAGRQEWERHISSSSSSSNNGGGSATSNSRNDFSSGVTNHLLLCSCPL